MFGRLKRLRSCTQKRWQHNVTGGQSCSAETPEAERPQLFTGGHCGIAVMPPASRPHRFYLEPERKCRNVKDELLQGKGQSVFAEMPYKNHPSQPVTGGQSWIAEMPKITRPHQFYLGQRKNAEMSSLTCPRGSTQVRRDAITCTPPPNLGQSKQRRNAVRAAPNNQRPPRDRSNAIAEAPRN